MTRLQLFVTLELFQNKYFKNHAITLGDQPITPSRLKVGSVTPEISGISAMEKKRDHSFDLTHSLSCKLGGFVIRRHNEIRNFTAHILQDICYDVQVEPPLQPVTTENLSSGSNTADEARLDVACRSFWREGQKAYFDVRVFNPLATTNLRTRDVYASQEKEKIRSYQSRVLQIEHGTFTPLVHSAFGGCSRLTNNAHKRMASLLAKKRNIPYEKAIHWLRTKISFILVRSVLLCMRGTRTKQTIAHNGDILLAHQRLL